ncbi:MAG TPA: hypothetical protein VGG33_16485 [Polyangia bacterium]
MSKAPLWKFPQLATCARSYVESRKSNVTTDLGIEKCLDFLESPQLAAAVTAEEDARPTCMSTAQVVEPGKAPTLE